LTFLSWTILIAVRGNLFRIHPPGTRIPGTTFRLLIIRKSAGLLSWQMPQLL